MIDCFFIEVCLNERAQKPRNVVFLINGEKVAELLMGIQGTFGSWSALRHSAIASTLAQGLA